MIETSEEHGQNPPSATQMSEPAPAAQHRARGLLAIAIFKLAKAVFFLALGIGALHLVHKNIGDLLLQIATTLHFDPEGQFVGILQDRADLISGHQLRTVSELSILYAMVSLTEGIGLMLEKTWAEYLTLILTICALPWELYELIRRPNYMHAGLLVINLGVLAYLLWFLRWHRRRKRLNAS